MTTHRFAPITAQRTKIGACPVCGRKGTRSRTFTQTVSPFNRNADGTVRTVDEIRTAVEGEATAWVPDFTHAACKAVAS